MVLVGQQANTFSQKIQRRKMANPATSSIPSYDPTYMEMKSDPMYPFFKTEYRLVHDQMYEYSKYKSSKQPKTTLLDRVKNMFTIFKFDMNFTQKSIEEYLSRSRDHYDLEQRERNVMSGKVRFA